MVLPWPLAEPIEEGFLGASCFDQQTGNFVFVSDIRAHSQLSLSSSLLIQVKKARKRIGGNLVEACRQVRSR